jgi:hypothetical protein
MIARWGTTVIGLAGVLLTLAVLPAGRTQADAPRTPVLVELFTSEGCSTCPPADLLLQKLDRSQPVAGAELVVLSEHVDYWNSDGWKDPFSSHLFSERQDDYVRHFRIEGPYTPQMVVDGKAEFVGSDEQAALRAIGDAARAKKIPVELSEVRVSGASVAAHVQTGPLAGQASVLLVLADDSDQSSVARGENAGRNLSHVAVVRSLTEVGNANAGEGFSKYVKVSLGSANRENLRVVAFVADAAGKILGVGYERLAN